MSKDNGKNQEEKPGKMKRKEFEKELEKLQVELVKLQRWVVHKGIARDYRLRRARCSGERRHYQAHR